MKLKQYLTEGSAEAIIEVLEKECQPFVNDLKKANLRHQLLFRGSKKKYTFEKVFVKQDRTPKDSTPELHSMADEMFKEKFNLELRSKTIFTTANANQAIEYGTAFIVFPIGKYEVYWSPRIKDLFEEVNDTWMTINQFKDGEPTNRKMEVELIDFFRDYPQEMSGMQRDHHYEDARLKLFTMINTYKKGNLKGAMRSFNEIMIHCRAVYMVNPHYAGALMDYFEKGIK